MSWLFFRAAQGAAQGATDLAPVETPVIIVTHSPTTFPEVSVTPTIDRLAAPPTVENPTQADEGAQLFWLHCQPCHGDVGQGLTDEWRDQYPEEDRNCWNSGCHGRRPYENGFTLPTAVPAVTGEDSLQRFETMGQVYGFMMAAMPYQDPGHLSEEEYLAIAAFLARAHDIWDGTPLDLENVGNYRLRLAKAAATAEPTTPPLAPIQNSSSDQDTGQSPDSDTTNTFFGGLVVGIIGSLLIVILLVKRKMA